MAKRRAAKKSSKRKTTAKKRATTQRVAVAPWMAAAGTGGSSHGLYSALAATTKRRGRKPGSKNKKTAGPSAYYASMSGTTPFNVGQALALSGGYSKTGKLPSKRGRKPGSKNKDGLDAYAKQMRKAFLAGHVSAPGLSVASPYSYPQKRKRGRPAGAKTVVRHKPKREAIMHVRAVGTHPARDIEVLEPTSAQMMHAEGVAPSFRQNWRNKWASKGEMHRHHNGYEWVYGGVHAAPQTFPRMHPGPSEVIPRRRKKKAAKKRRATGATRRTAAKRTTTTRRTAAKRHTGPKRGRPKGTTKTAMQAKEALAKKFLAKISCRACAGKGCIKCHIKLRK